jgi:hypothetical protein
MNAIIKTTSILPKIISLGFNLRIFDNEKIQNTQKTAIIAMKQKATTPPNAVAINPTKIVPIRGMWNKQGKRSHQHNF